MHAERRIRHSPLHTSDQDLKLAPQNDPFSSLVSVPRVVNLMGLVVVVIGPGKSPRYVRWVSFSVVKIFVFEKLTRGPRGRAFWPNTTTPVDGYLPLLKFMKPLFNSDTGIFEVEHVLRLSRFWIFDIFVRYSFVRYRVRWPKMGKFFFCHASEEVICVG